MSPALLLQPLAASEHEWRRALQQVLPDIEIRIWPDAGDPADIHYAAVQALPSGTLAGFPNLKLVCSLLAGQDHLLADPDLPAVPIARTDPTVGNQSIIETVIMHVLRHYRRLPDYAQQQRLGQWRRLGHAAREETCVTFLGLGVLGRPAALAVQALGFRVLGWTRTARKDSTIEVFSGDLGLDRLLPQTDILVNMLPLTPSTVGVLGWGNLTKLRPGCSLINIGRGAHLPPNDLYRALDAGIVSSATLDVFDPEPPPPDERVWHDPRITLTPHVARIDFVLADTVAAIAEAVEAVRAGHLPRQIVEPARGY